jgi:hypothetical protein
VQRVGLPATHGARHGRIDGARRLAQRTRRHRPEARRGRGDIAQPAAQPLPHRRPCVDGGGDLRREAPRPLPPRGSGPRRALGAARLVAEPRQEHVEVTRAAGDAGDVAQVAPHAPSGGPAEDASEGAHEGPEAPQVDAGRVELGHPRPVAREAREGARRARQLPLHEIPRRRGGGGARGRSRARRHRQVAGASAGRRLATSSEMS